MNTVIWRKALTVIPSVSKEEWSHLDVFSKWLISTRAAVLTMTLTSAILAGLFAWRDQAFHLWPWLTLTFGLLMAHASNNLLNDHIDFARGVDQQDYARALYGPHPLKNQLLTRRQHLMYFLATGALALGSGLILLWLQPGDWLIWPLLGLGAFILLFYTWPLKYIALGEVAVLLVWGPLMVGGGYYVLAHHWNWDVTLASLVYALGVTTVIFGKHIDKRSADQRKHIYTLPTLLGESAARGLLICMLVLSYWLLIYLIGTHYFTPIVLLTFLALPRFFQVLPAFLKPRPKTRPPTFRQGQGGWPLYFAPLAFWYNRTFGGLFIFSLFLDTLLRLYLPTFWR